MSPKKPTIHLATDHAGLAHKEAVKSWLSEESYEVVDHGSHEFDPLDDFTDAILPAAKAVSADPKNCKAIIFGGSGQGEAMIANRFPQVRAAVFYGGDQQIITMSRQHNNANILSLGARFVDIDIAKRVVWDWLHTTFDGQEKYERRNREIDSLTQN